MDITTALDLLRRLDADPGRLPDLRTEIQDIGARLAEAEDASEAQALTSEKQQLQSRADDLARELLIAARRVDPLYMDNIVARMSAIDGEIKARMDEVRLLCVELEDLVFKADEAAGIYAAIDSAYDIPFRLNNFCGVLAIFPDIMGKYFPMIRCIFLPLAHFLLLIVFRFQDPPGRLPSKIKKKNRPNSGFMTCGWLVSQ